MNITSRILDKNGKIIGSYELRNGWIYSYNRVGQHHSFNGPSKFLIRNPLIGFEFRHNGKLHNENGPACVGRGGVLRWYIDDYMVTSTEDYLYHTGKSKEWMTSVILKYGWNPPVPFSHSNDA